VQLADGVRAVADLAFITADSAYIAQLAGDLGVEHRDYFAERLPLQDDGLGQVLLALRATRIVGALFLYWGEADEPEIRRLLAKVPLIFHLHVAPPHRRNGIGTALLAEAEERLRRRGHSMVLLGVDKSNTVARRLYEKLGYVQPEEPELGDLRARSDPAESDHSVGEAYDILVADLYRT
jgi:ribosomal protein S18 acetylase RimI-like enzyme